VFRDLYMACRESVELNRWLASRAGAASRCYGDLRLASAFMNIREGTVLRGSGNVIAIVSCEQKMRCVNSYMM
jgi:hypothetical protein